MASIFRRGSRTYFYSSIFFPTQVREDVFTLYAFVRLADDFVDQVPQDAAGLDAFESRYRAALSGATTGDEVVDGYVALASRRDFDPAWTDSFFDAMRQDLTKRVYEDMAETKQYMYGSAEVVGLLMANVMGLPRAAHPAARKLGRAMQYINFLRDVDEDADMGRTYVPQEVLGAFGLQAASRRVAATEPERFDAMMRHEVQRYRVWQAEAASGYRFLPRRYRIPIQTAADMYAWTARRIDERPQRVFEGKIKPSVARIVGTLLVNTLKATAAPKVGASAKHIGVARPTAG
jgi:phytoene synthase